MILPEALPDEVTEVTEALSGNRKTLLTIVSTYTSWNEKNKQYDEEKIKLIVRFPIHSNPKQKRKCYFSVSVKVHIVWN